MTTKRLILILILILAVILAALLTIVVAMIVVLIVVTLQGGSLVRLSPNHKENDKSQSVQRNIPFSTCDVQHQFVWCRYRL